MNWLKVGAVVIGGIVIFFVLDSVVHLLLGLLTAIAFVAIVAGGGYVAYKIMGARRRRQVKATQEPEERRVRRDPEPADPRARRSPGDFPARASRGRRRRARAAEAGDGHLTAGPIGGADG